MQTLTLHGFLKNYLKHLSGMNTGSLSKLSKLALVNPRLQAPMVLYIAVAVPKQQRQRLYKVNPLLEVELRRYFDGVEDDKGLVRVLQEHSIPNEYQKAYKSYLVVRDRAKHERELKCLVRNKIMELAEEKQISDYRVYKDLGISGGNYHAFVRKGEMGRLGFDKVRQVLEYLESSR